MSSHAPSRRFRKKPVVIEAVQWFKEGDHPEVKMGWRHGNDKMAAVLITETNTPEKLVPVAYVLTREGWHIVTPGDWIITGVQGEHYPCKPDIFAATYEFAASEKGDTLHLSEATILDLVEQATRREREACAALVEKIAVMEKDPHTANELHWTARNIRARTKEPT